MHESETPNTTAAMPVHGAPIQPENVSAVLDSADFFHDSCKEGDISS